MKKTTLVIAMAIGLSSLLLSSCKHDYQCRCTVLGVTTTTDWENSKLRDRDDYKDICDDNNQEAQSLGGSCEFRED